MHDEFMADLYPRVHESLKFSVDEHVFVEDPISSTGTLSSMNNLEDAFAIGDQFINEKSTEDELKKPNVDLFEEDMKEMLHQRMFESGSYKSVREHIALHEALEASIERAQRDLFLAKKDKSCKRRRDDQDPPTPLSDSDMSKRRRHDTDASGSSQPQAPYDLEDLNLLLLQGHLNHLSGSDKRFEFKHDYTIIESRCVVVFPIELRSTRLIGSIRVSTHSSDKDVERIKEFIHAIERRLKTRRIFQNLECFVGGWVRDIDYRLLQRMECKNIRVIPKYHSEDGNPARANIKQVLGR
nr:hypothetical protein [Tanacetum cinerariifolium]